MSHAVTYDILQFAGYLFIKKLLGYLCKNYHTQLNSPPSFQQILGYYILLYFKTYYIELKWKSNATLTDIEQ